MTKSVCLLVLVATFVPVANIQAQPDAPAANNRRSRMLERMSRFPLIRALDKNSDGEISEDELQDASKTLLSLDTNGNGELDSSETRPRFERGNRTGRPGRPQRSDARGTGQDDAPKVGEMAPDFELTYVKEPAKKVRLSSFVGKQPVALIFGSCT